MMQQQITPGYNTPAPIYAPPPPLMQNQGVVVYSNGAVAPIQTVYQSQPMYMNTSPQPQYMVANPVPPQAVIVQQQSPPPYVNSSATGCAFCTVCLTFLLCQSSPHSPVCSIFCRETGYNPCPGCCSNNCLNCGCCC